jgi:hypothetical protein
MRRLQHVEEDHPIEHLQAKEEHCYSQEKSQYDVNDSIPLLKTRELS